MVENKQNSLEQYCQQYWLMCKPAFKSLACLSRVKSAQTSAPKTVLVWTFQYEIYFLLFNKETLLLVQFSGQMSALIFPVWIPLQTTVAGVDKDICNFQIKPDNSLGHDTTCITQMVCLHIFCGFTLNKVKKVHFKKMFSNLVKILSLSKW